MNEKSTLDTERQGRMTPDDLDFLEEMMNVGACYAGTAFTKLIGHDVEIMIPAVALLPAESAPKNIGGLTDIVSCVRMRAVGDATGDLFFTVARKHETRLAALAERALPGSGWSPEAMSPGAQASSIMKEIANILAGAYLTAIDEFCGLRIFHSVPELSTDMAQALLDETIAQLVLEGRECILVENRLVAGEDEISTFLFIVFRAESTAMLLGGIAEARRRMTA